MSRGFVKEGDQEEVPMVLPRAFLPQGVPNYVTPEGLLLLNEEMEGLKKERAEAASNYILINHIEAKMRQLSERINTAVLIDPSKSDPDVVSFGFYVRYNDKTIRIVGVDEADASKGLISFLSPIAKSLIGKRKGDVFEVKVPRGTERIEVQEVALVLEIQELRSSGDERQQDHKTTRQQVVEERKEEKIVEVTRNSDLPSTESTTDTVTELNSSMAQQLNSSMAQQFNGSTVQQREFKVENNPTDFLPIINERGNIVGRALYCEIHNGNKVLHPAVHLIVFNSKNETVAKYCWHVAFGETPEKTLKSRIPEVTSESIKPKFKKQYIREDKNEKELVSVFTVVCNGDVLSSPEGMEYEAMFEKY